MASDTTYLPKMHTRIGKAGYKGKNIVEVDAGDPRPAAAVVTAPDGTVVPKAAAPRRGSRSKLAPKAGLKALKVRGKK